MKNLKFVALTVAVLGLFGLWMVTQIQPVWAETGLNKMVQVNTASLPQIEVYPTGGPYDEEATVSGEFTVIPQEEAYNTVLTSGVDPEKIVYFDIVPYDKTGKGDFEMAWGAVICDKVGLLGIFVDAINGKLLAEFVPLHEGLKSRVVDLAKQGALTGVGQYQNYPWGYDLPTNYGNYRVSCMYNCSGYHQGANFYAVDFVMSIGTCLPAPGSGFCYFTGDRGDGYGNQGIIVGKDPYSNTYYPYRLAHMNQIYIRPGWWIDKNRTVGTSGNTGTSYGPHLHFSIHRGYYSSGRIYGNSIPLDRWPGPNDRVDYFDRNSQWQFSFNVCR